MPSKLYRLPQGLMMSKPSHKKQEHRRKKEQTRAKRSLAYEQKMARMAKSPAQTFQADNTVAQQIDLTAETQEAHFKYTPLFDELLQLGNSTVNFDASMRQFVELTKVGFSAMRRAAKDVQKAVDELGLGSGQPTHAYLQLINQASKETFATGPISEIRAGGTCINHMILCFVNSIRQDLFTTKQGMEKVIASGAAQTDVKLHELLQFYIVDQLSREFAHTFGVRPEAGRIKDFGVYAESGIERFERVGMKIHRTGSGKPYDAYLILEKLEIKDRFLPYGRRHK
jgi:hypothetical protein